MPRSSTTPQETAPQDPPVKPKADETAEATPDPTPPGPSAESLLAKLRKHAVTMLPNQRMSRLQIQNEEWWTANGLSPIWVYDGPRSSNVTTYRRMGYELFELPDGMSLQDVCPAATIQGSMIRVDDVVLMYTTIENRNRLLSMVEKASRQMQIDQSNLIATGDEAGELPVEAWGELKMSRRPLNEVIAMAAQEKAKKAEST